MAVVGSKPGGPACFGLPDTEHHKTRTQRCLYNSSVIALLQGIAFLSFERPSSQSAVWLCLNTRSLTRHRLTFSRAPKPPGPFPMTSKIQTSHMFRYCQPKLYDFIHGLGIHFHDES